MAQLINFSILLIAGDVSGDLNMARLARLLLERHPYWTLYAVGGPHLGSEAVKSKEGEWIGDTSDLSGIGIYSSLKMIPRARRIARRMREFALGHKIDAAVLCDWGAFNCRQLEFLKSAGIPVLYYFPPGSWNRKGRKGLGIAPLVERVATPFEWSAQRLGEAGCKAEWVGHPLLEIKYPEGRREELRAEFGVGGNEKLIALLPGSRMSEINCLAPRLAEAAGMLRAKGGMRFAAAVAERRVEAARKHFPDWVKIVPERSADLLYACDAAVVKSGTVTLEAAVIGAPQVMVYDFPWAGRIEWLFLWMWKKNIPFIAMPNVILQRLAIRELLGLECTPEKIAAAATELLENGAVRARLAEDYREIRERLGAALPKSATERTLEILEELVYERAPHVPSGLVVPPLETEG